MDIEDILDFPYDPWLILGVPRETDNKTVNSAWKKAGSPDNGPLAQAYRLLKDKPSRLQTELLFPHPYLKATDAASALKKHPVFLGPGVWYDEIMRKSRS